MTTTTTIAFISILITALLGIGALFFYKLFLVRATIKHRTKQAKHLKFLQIKISKTAVKNTEGDSGDSVSSMKQNIEIMNQVYKNIYAIAGDSRKERTLGNNYLSMELFIEKEVIKFIVGVSDEHLDTIEKVIGGFYPGAVSEYIAQPKLLETGKYMDGGEFTLSKDSIFPIRTYESFEADPMDSLLSAYSKVNVDEKICLQLLIQPVEENLFKSMREKTDEAKKKKKGFWKELIAFFNTDDKKEEKEDKNYEFGQNQLGDLDKKLNDEIFAVKIKAFATSPDPIRPKKIIDDLAKSFFQYTYSGLNGFKFKHAKNIINFVHYFNQRMFWSDDSTRNHILTISKRQILNIKELSSLVHFPHPKFNKNSRIRWQNFKLVAAPFDMPDDGIVIGWNNYNGIKKTVRLTLKDRFRHLYLIGQTGSGKSTLLITQAVEDMKAGNGFCIMDPHGELVDFIMDRFPKERINDLIYFDLSNTEYPIAFNPLDGPETDDERDVVTNDLIEMFVSMYGEEIFGPRIQDYFRNACFLLMEQPEGGTLIDIMRLFTDDAFAESKIRNVKNPIIASWWNKTYKKMGDREKAEIIPFIQAKFGPFTTGTYVRNIIGQPKSAFNFGQAMQENKIILCKLAKGLVGEENSKLIGRMVAMQIKLAALKRAAIEEKDRVPFFLYVDEFQNYVSQSFESILSEARKYRLGLTMAHQYMDQLHQKGLGGDLDLSKTILGNVGTIIALKIGPNDAETLENVFSPEFSKNDLMSSEIFNGIMRMSINGSQSKPFSYQMKIPYNDPVVNTKEKVAIMQQISSLKRGTKRELVDKEIFFRVGV
ncbi:MAG: TraM recognition domain-containing protein [Candidatus Absconditabacteria bacterium]